MREQIGQEGSVPSQRREAQSKQNKLWPQGTNAAFISFSPQTIQSLLFPRLMPVMLARESVGEAEAVGEGRVVMPVVLAEDGKDQIFEEAVVASKPGDSPIPSSLSKLEFQIDTRSPRRPFDEELLELNDPDELNAPELAEDVRDVGGNIFKVSAGNPVLAPVGSKQLKRLPKPVLYNDASNSELSSMRGVPRRSAKFVPFKVPAPVLIAM